MIVVSDTSPVSNLLIIDKLNILQQIFNKIIIPEKVYEELIELEKFQFDLSELKNANWIEIKKPKNIELVGELKQNLDAGEAEGIVLAKELNADYLLIDEKDGRKTAMKLGLTTIGILGILVKAKEKEIIGELKPIIDELIEKAGFWLDKELYKTVLTSVNE